MRSLFLVIFVFSTINAFAHEGHNWLNDKKAYQSVAPLSIPEAASLKKYGDINISTDFLKTKLSELSGATSVKIGNETVTISERKSATNRILARKYLIQEYDKLGFATGLAPYGSNKSVGTTWGGSKNKYLNATKANFIAEKTGQDPSKVLIISSHMDSVGNAGANDDGTGTISALAVAKALSDLNFTYTLRVLAFDQEELGLLGSKAYVNSLSDVERTKIMGVINLEMMGTNSRKDGVFHVIDCDKENSKFLTNEITTAIQTYSIDLSPNTACTDRSDHASFWKKKIPAVVLSENFFGGDSDNCYHRSCDILDDRLDFNYMGKITQAVAVSVRELLIPLAK